MMKKFLALARVSSREQEREGFSLEVQEQALLRHAAQQGGEISKFFRIAETATRPDERKTFKELLAYAKQHADSLAGLLFFKVDRAARNLFDYVELERLEIEHHVPVIYVTQPTENTPAGRMMRRTLANMASFYTEQQSLDVKDGLSRRIQAGLFISKAPYGYRNVRREGRGLIETVPEHAKCVRRVFELYAFHEESLDSLELRLFDEGMDYCDSQRRFSRSKLHSILKDRSYLGEVQYQGNWYPGVHEALVDLTTYDRVQEKLGGRLYQTRDLVYAGELITCGECGHPITGELKTKPSKSGSKEYVYYRCGRYNRAGHRRTRINEVSLDSQVLELFDRMRLDEDDRAWFGKVLRARGEESARLEKGNAAENQRQLTSLKQQRDRLLNLRLLDEIDQDTFAAKSTELRDRIARLESAIAEMAASQGNLIGLAAKVFELSQTLREKWVRANTRERHRLLRIVCLNFSLVDVTLVPTMRKPFDLLAEGRFVLLSRGYRI